MPDFIVTNHGTVIRIEAQTPAAIAWVEENVEIEGWQGSAASFGCDHRPGWGLVDILEDSGLFEVDVQHV